MFARHQVTYVRLATFVVGAVALSPLVALPATAQDPGRVQLVTENAAGTATGAWPPGFQTVLKGSPSADGRRVAFASPQRDLVPGATAGGVFVRDTATGSTSLVSVTQQGTASPQGGGGVSISQDGRFVVFTSGASDLVAGDDDGGLYDVFLRDLVRGRTVHVSVGAPGVTGADGQSVTTPDVSRDGRYVAFASFAADLVPGDRNETRDVFVRDVVAGTTTLVSRGPNGASVGPVDDAPLISDDGATIVFGSFAPDLVAGDRNETSDVFTWRRDQGVTLVSTAKDGVGSGDGYSIAPSLSADGTRVAFQSQARNLVVGASERAYTEDIFVRDLTTGTTRLVSRNRAGLAAGSAGGVAISADGRRVAYVSFAEGAIGDDMAGNDLVVYDLGTGSTWLVRSADGEPSRGFTLSGNGRRVAFTSTGNYQVHLAELPSRGPLTVQRISNTPLGVAGNSVSTAPFISRNGRMVVFASAATDLVDVKDVNLTNYDLFTWR